MKFAYTPTPKRQCTKCKHPKPIKGGTSKMGKFFICKECKEKESETRLDASNPA